MKRCVRDLVAVDLWIPWILTVVSLTGPVWGSVAPALLQGRSVVVQVGADALVPGESFASTGSVSVTVAIKPTAADASFALVLSGARPGDVWSISINGKPYEYDGLYPKGEAWYMVPAGYLKSGENTLVLTAPSGDTPPLDEVTLFSLKGFAEEEHFDRLALGPAILVQPPTDPAQDKMDVLHCDLAMTLNMSAATIPSAVMTMTAKSLDSSLSTCVLDLDDNSGNLVVSAVDSGPSTAALPFNQNGAQNRVFITLPAAVPAGNTFTVRVFYSGTPIPNQGFRRTVHPRRSTTPLIYTIAQPPENARQWWPCKDVPWDKFTSTLHVTCPTTLYIGYPLYVVSNGTLESIEDNGNGTRTFNWNETYPIASQYVSITCTNYEPAPGVYTALDGVTTMSVCHQVYPESWASESQELPRTIEVMQFFANTFGEYPFLREKYWTSTWGYGGGMEHQTATSMPNNNLNNPPYHRRNVHELSHMWFGVAIGINSFDHIWISEGWATYCEALWLEHKNGFASYQAQMESWKASSSDAVPIVDPSADSFTLSITYYKAAWVLHMVRHIIGDAAFFQGARDYLSDPTLRYQGAADSSDVERHFESTSGRDLSWFFNEWLYRASRPYYNWTWATTTKGTTTTLHFGIRQNQSDSVYVMPIDVRVHYQNGSSSDYTIWNDARIQNFTVDVGTIPVQTVELDPEDWVLDVKSQVAATAPTQAPTLTSVSAGPGYDRMTIEWNPFEQYGLVGFRLSMSEDGTTGWTVVQDEGTLDANSTSAVVTGLAPGDARYFRLTAVANGTSPDSNVLGATIPYPPVNVRGWMGL